MAYRIHLRKNSSAGSWTKDWIGEAYSDRLEVSWGKTHAAKQTRTYFPRDCPLGIKQEMIDRAEKKMREGYWVVSEETFPEPAQPDPDDEEENGQMPDSLQNQPQPAQQGTQDEDNPVLDFLSKAPSNWF